MLIRLHQAVTMIKEYNESVQQKHMHMEQAGIQYLKKEIKCNNLIKQHEK